MRTRLNSRFLSHSLRVLLGLALAGLAFGSTRAEDLLLLDEKKQSYGSVTVGYDGSVVSDVPTPITVTLKNPNPQALFLRLQLSGAFGDSQHSLERSLSIESNTVKVLRFNLRISSELTATLFQGSRVLVKATQTLNELPDVPRRFLLVHGSDRKAPSLIDDSGQFLFATTPVSAFPYDWPCLAAFNIILFDGIDPNSLDPAQLQALDYFVRHGGVMALTRVNKQDLGARTWFDKHSGASERLSTQLRAGSHSVEIPWDFKAAGVGYVAMTSKDLVEDVLVAAPANSVTSVLQGLFSTLRSPERGSFPRNYTRNNDESGDPSSFVLMFAFFAGYLLFLGPIIAILYRRAPRPKLAKALIIVVLGFIVLAPAIAFMIRNSSAALRVFSLIEFDSNGEALQTSEFRLVSGGGQGYRVELQGSPEAIALIPSPQRNASRDDYYRNVFWGQNNNRFDAFDTQSYDLRRPVSGTMELGALPIESWERYSFFVADRPAIKPLDIDLRKIKSSNGKEGWQIELFNNSPYTFGKICFGENNLVTMRYQTIATSLSPRERVRVNVNWVSSKGAEVTNSLDTAMGINYQASWHGWAQIPKATRLVLVGRVKDVPHRPIGTGVNIYDNRCVWIQGIKPLELDAPIAKRTAGLGIRVDLGSNPWSSGSNVRIIGVEPGSPADLNGLKIDDFIMRIGDSGINTLLDLQQALTGPRPGAAVRIDVMRIRGDGNRGYGNNQRQFSINLGAPYKDGDWH